MNHELVSILFNLKAEEFAQKETRSAAHELKQVLDLFLSVNGLSLSIDKIDFRRFVPYFISTQPNPGPLDSAISVNADTIAEKLGRTANWITPMTFISIFSILECYLLGIKEHIEAHQIRKSVFDYLLAYYEQQASKLRPLIPDKFDGIVTCLNELKTLNTPRNKFAHRRKQNGNKYDFTITLPEVLSAWLYAMFLLVAIDDLLMQGALSEVRNGS